MPDSIDAPVDVLIVDDTPANLLSMEEVLASPDLNLVKCESGEQALEKALALRPALILLDVQMPGMDGFEVARLLRSTQRTKEIPIIFVTATQREERLTFKGFESGAVDYLFKPLNPVILRSKVSIFVELFRGRMRLERAVRDLSAINKELESFSYSVSHDLRAPLRSILGFTQIVMDQMTGSEDKDSREKLQRVIAAAERMGRLIESLLSLARLTRAEMNQVEVNLSDIAGQICTDLCAENSEREIETKVTPGLKAPGDRNLLENVLRNLIGNSFKFTRDASPARIEFGSMQTGAGRAYFVRDNGAGFDMKYARKLFGTFQRLHNESEFPGTGVGLATVQRIVHRHGGRIWAEAEPGKGATFFFTLG